MGAARSAARFLAATAAVLLALSTASFLLIHIAPGDAAQSVAQARAGDAATEEQVEQIRAELGLDKPLTVQYWQWLSGVVQGDFGTSARTDEPVATELAKKLPVTLALGGVGAVVGTVTGLGAGIAGALLRSGLRRGGLRGAALLGVSVPSFVLAYLLIYSLAEQLRLLPTYGQGRLASWVMPVAVLAIPTAAVLSRVVATTLSDALDEPYIVAARARGSTPFAVVVRHALPNAAGAILNTAGFLIASLLVGAIIVEKVFAWNGIGSYYVDAVSFRDVQVIQACVLVFGLTYVTVNRAVDALHHRVDPRLRLGAGG